jgi:hypothetical protein
MVAATFAVSSAALLLKKLSDGSSFLGVFHTMLGLNMTE